MFAKVYLEISNICNLNCSFCPSSKRSPSSLNCEQFEFLAKKIRPFTRFLYLHVKGEPLLHPNLKGILDIANDLDFRVIITTNGTLLKNTEEVLLSAKALHKVNISLHSLEANADFTMENYIENCAEFAKKAMKNSILINFRLWNLGDGLNTENQNILNTLHQTFTGEWVENNTGYKIDKKVYLQWGEKFDWPSLNAKYLGEDCFCYGLRDQIAVLSDGTVTPCCLDQEGDINLGNLFKEDLKIVLEKKKSTDIYNGFSSRKAVETLCKHCGYARRF